MILEDTGRSYGWGRYGWEKLEVGKDAMKENLEIAKETREEKLEEENVEEGKEAPKKDDGSATKKEDSE